jgi:hypothetical protein
LPFAWRLYKEGVEVRVVVNKDRYERAWAGLLPKEMQGPAKTNARWESLLKEAIEGGDYVLTDVPKVFEFASGYERLYRPLPFATEADLPVVYFGGWYSQGEAKGFHYVFPDWGFWPGGYGPTQISSGVLYAPTNVSWSHWTKVLPEAELEGYRGAFWVGVRWNDVTNEFERIHTLTGFPSLFTHLLLSDQAYCPLLEGSEPSFPNRFVVSMSISVPPYPYTSIPGSAPIPIPSLEPHLSNTFVHDVALKDGQVWTAGTDGLIGYVRASGDILSLALQDALGVATSLRIPQVQYRPDVGAGAALGLRGLSSMDLL